MQKLENRNRITVTVNDKEMQVYEGLTILQALLQEDINIPHLCYDIRLTVQTATAVFALSK